MKLIFVIAVISLFHKSEAFKEIIGILDNAYDLMPEELNALRPIFTDLQYLYDHIVSEAANNNNNNKTNEEYDLLYETTRSEFEQYFNTQLLSVESSSLYEYNISLPMVEDLIITTNINNSSIEQYNELLDIQETLEDTINEANVYINQYVKRSLRIEAELIKINKPKAIGYIYRALLLLFKVSVRVSRASYCIYSHIPQLNASLEKMYEGANCYANATRFLLTLQNETVQTIETIKQNIFNLADIYKKIAKKNTLVGKIFTLLLNVNNIGAEISNTYTTATNSLNNLEYQLPEAVRTTAECGQNFIDSIPNIIEPVTNVTDCILFVDKDEEDYDFLKPYN